ncbi:hypothetical protein ACQR18_26260 [Bradyrhizobium oligotrophicum]|uniref:hypothetical protein n=1 Tax=Bradyrhizobium oligotrophicum TaxID=44255 RepID=UPI003EBC094F
MRYWGIRAAITLGLLLPSSAFGQQTFSSYMAGLLGASSPLSGTSDKIMGLQGGAAKTMTPYQILSLVSGDCSIASPPSIICTKTNGAPFANIATSGSASDLATGTVPAARGGAGTVNGVLKADGAGNVSVAAKADIGLGNVPNTDATNMANVSFTGLSAAAAAANTDTLPVNQGAGNLKQTFTAIQTWIRSWITKTDVGLANVPNTDATNMANAASGTLAVARGGTGDTGTAWSTFTPSPACGTGTFTVTSARYKTLGKTVYISLDVTITAVTGCSNSFTFNGPMATVASAAITGREVAVNAKTVACSWTGSTGVGVCVKADGSALGVNERFVVSGVIESL